MDTEFLAPAGLEPEYRLGVGGSINPSLSRLGTELPISSSVYGIFDIDLAGLLGM